MCLCIFYKVSNMLDIFLVYLVTWFEDFFKKDFFLNNSFSSP